ncbi:MAG TPA: RagB/SusD family nutrient uptake outer membrane protein, partial [Flavobacterium sp.]|nr:RagB/SusD family nutrient uptake outer membrane protein [Flavobacterium sp.]
MANSCTDELDKKPLNTRTPEKEYTSVNGYKTGLVSVFSNLAYTPFLRFYWGMQEYTTDEAVNSWNDDGRVWAYHDFNWSADLPAISTVYKAALDIITEANFFISESTSQKIASRGFSATDSAKITQFQAEARFLRAFSFWVLMDAFGNPPFPTADDLGTKAPKQIQRADLFKFIENELKEIEPILAAPKTNERGRPCRAAAWALLSRMYLNGKIYTGQDYYTDAITYCDKIINSGYTLENRYDWLMIGDNHLNTNEFIFTINYDNTNYTFDSTNFLILGPANVPATVNGLSNSWRSFRVTQQFVSIFGSDISIDKRAMFYTTGQNRVVTSIPTSTDGYSAFKYRNVDRSGSSIKQSAGRSVQLSDVDFPLFRLAEIYL